MKLTACTRLRMIFGRKYLVQSFIFEQWWHEGRYWTKRGALGVACAKVSSWGTATRWRVSCPKWVMEFIRNNDGTFDVTREELK